MSKSSEFSPIKVEVGPRKVGDVQFQDWWIAQESEAYRHLIAVVQAIDDNQTDRKWMDLRNAYLYQNRQPPGVMHGASAAATPSAYDVTYNVVKAGIDTLTAKIAQNKPRTRILTEKGDYPQQSRAQDLTQYVDGTMEDSGAYRQGPDVFRDGGVFGTGCLKVMPDYVLGKIVTERNLITEIKVDDLEAAYGRPRAIYQVRPVSRASLMARFPEKKALLSKASPEPNYSKGRKIVNSDMIRVYEGWHLPDDTEGTNGRHVLCIAEGNLVVEGWKHDRFPFAFFRYNTSIASFYGQGIAEELCGTQMEINKLLRDIQRAQHLIAVPRILKERNSKVNSAHFNNTKGSVIEYTGTKPDFHTPVAMNNEIYNHVKWLISSAFEKIGVSQLSSSGKKPAGLDAAVAMREYRDIETERFASTAARYTEFYEDVANLIIMFSKDLYEHIGDLKIKATTKKFIQTIKWSDVDMDADRFTLRMHSSSLFATSPAAKLQQVEEYVRSGWMTKQDGIREMESPDTAAWATLETADRDYLERIISDILGKGEYAPPEPEMLLENDISVARQHYLDALNTGASNDRLELLLRWIEAAASLLPEPPAAPAPTPAMPMAPPLPMAPSGLVPQVGDQAIIPPQDLPLPPQV